jgi:phosphate transport system substrate-binding protein
VVSIKVGDAFVAPSADGAAKALEASPVDDTRTKGDLAVKVDRTTTAAGAYPLMLTSYLIACPTYAGDKADLVKSFLKYIVSTDGQQQASSNAGSAPLPSTLQQKAEEIIDSISAK